MERSLEFEIRRATANRSGPNSYLSFRVPDFGGTLLRVWRLRMERSWPPGRFVIFAYYSRDGMGVLGTPRDLDECALQASLV